MDTNNYLEIPVTPTETHQATETMREGITQSTGNDQLFETPLDIVSPQNTIPYEYESDYHNNSGSDVCWSYDGRYEKPRNWPPQNLGALFDAYSFLNCKITTTPTIIKTDLKSRVNDQGLEITVGDKYYFNNYVGNGVTQVRVSAIWHEDKHETESDAYYCDGSADGNGSWLIDINKLQRHRPLRSVLHTTHFK